ncbi:MAG: AlpA family transcriptional regulator [Gammaproteobacteria bacterium]|nr:AlpA family transcriptional regulator [Gammaproteobacteria bacterium]MBU0818905.1 AlpA family transcriptional regulator [Gammaproteobacteria bacterium]MBU0844309.1 AlpA family transcriptional regulator [Gammaproteobacteria bacterium]MBU1843536.1 AlpA family transcriptional regulator [Gammaproteobacteria bacterium]
MKILRLKDVMHTTGLSRSTVYSYISEGTFPKSVQLGSRAVGWVESEVQDWLMERVKERDELALFAR